MKKLPIATICLLTLAMPIYAAEENLVKNGDFETKESANRPAGFELTGAAEYRYLGDAKRDISSMGVALQSSRSSGEVNCTINNLDSKAGRWFRFTFRGLPQGNFAVTQEDLYMKVEFIGAKTHASYDGKDKKIYEQITDARRDLTVNGVRHAHGAEVWRTYQLDFMLPFPQVDQVRLGIGFGHGAGKSSSESDFLVDDLSLMHIPDPQDLKSTATQPTAVVPEGMMLPLGGRWFYAAKEGETSAPQLFDSSNVDRLLYHDAVYTAPFAGNTSAWLRPGFMDLVGNVVKLARLVNDNVTVRFSSGTMVIASHGIPNHPTGRFPEQGFGNPSYIREQQSTFYIPLEPSENLRHFVTDTTNSNRALPMGPIGIAINGVVFFNPFDMGNTDATDMMDRCCGHPQQQGVYHYHKYPICVNSPWSDEGNAHSPLLGWAFDGYPVYGPYERADVMAKDITGTGALNGFNMHYDADRGWHYHVTPGKFPYLIGGYWGTLDSRNSQRPPRGGGPGGGPGGGMRGPGGGGGPSPGNGPPPDRRGPE